jgi:hypothetical protein
VAANGECQWKIGTPNWKAVYHYPIHSNDGDIEWRILHNRIVTPQQLHQWSNRKTAQKSPNITQLPVVIAKSTVYKTYMATNSTHGHITDHGRTFRMRRQYIDMHYSLWKNDMKTFKTYWRHENNIRKIQDGKIILKEEF